MDLQQPRFKDWKVVRVPSTDLLLGNVDDGDLEKVERDRVGPARPIKQANGSLAVGGA